MKFATDRAPAWATPIGLIVMHVGALGVFLPGMFSWSAVAVAVVLYYAIGSWGICLGYHRLLTHRSLTLAKPLEYALAILGALALQGGPIDWVATHRAHHAHTDEPGDPHDSNRGMWWSHLEWLYKPNTAMLSYEEQLRFVPDLAREPFYVFLEKTQLWWSVALAAVLFAIGGWPFVVWAVFLRVALTYHVTWLVNSAAHQGGYQSYRTGDRSRNNWWVAVLAWGEGWHNNHHAFPSSARHGLRWYEIDATWITIRALGMMRIARDIKLPTLAMQDRLKF
jgi:stearoyl-CoA desaturase (delta-9 desaturase)